MFAIQPVCGETVSILWALVFGAGEACVDLSLWSVLGALIPVAAAIMGLQWIVRRLLFGRPESRGRSASEPFRPRAGQVSDHIRATPEP